MLASFIIDTEGVYCGLQSDYASEQAEEKLLRKRVATEQDKDYLSVIALNHSIPVMDYEVDRFLRSIPEGGLIIDIGGCWGWHWRRLAETRSDVGVLIIDFVRENLTNSEKVLGGLVGTQIALMHADATCLPYQIGNDFLGFDGVWTTQTIQHIPDFEQSVSEVYRTLKRGGIFANYSLKRQPHIQMLYRLLGKHYVIEERVDEMYWLARASAEQKQLIENIFAAKVKERWSEILYSPELHFIAPGRIGSWLGKIDTLLSNNIGLMGWFARQCSFHCKKP